MPLIVVADLAGTTVFALEGALTAGASGLDWLGILVVAFVTALGGGMLRDVLIGAVPPAALRSMAYPTAVLAAATVAVTLAGPVSHYGRTPLLILDAAGLALFTVAGTEKALSAGLWGFGSAVLGTVTATGGGAVRDILLARVPIILREDFYATAAFAGAITLWLMRLWRVDKRTAAIAGGLACFTLRLAGAALGWHLPRL